MAHRLSSNKTAAAPALRAEPGCRFYVIGDLHGRADLLELVLGWIDRDVVARPSSSATEILLGDLVDRGPDSRKVIERLAGPALGRRRIVLRGNHEEVMLRFLADPEYLPSWVQLGGFETLMSYGVKRRPIRSREDRRAIWNEAQDCIPAEHVEFLRSTVHYHIDGSLLFVHAGLRPGLTLEQQSLNDLLWIREPFLSFQGSFGYHVVHGHTPIASAEHLPNRTNIDTGAYASDRLSCLIVDEGGSQIVTTRRVAVS